MYRLHWKINTMSSLSKKRACLLTSKGGLSAQKGRIIIMIKKSENISPSAIAEHLSHTRATVTQQINELELEGYIEKIEDPNDKRRVVVHLTSKGEMEFDHIDQNITKIEKDLSNIYTKEEQKEFDALLTKGITYYRKVTKGANN
ncbi:MAG: MarR family transcriptional regulator [Bacilli bacterium]|nr:MarR family transcriptional regulator [Bacilli bacterium]